MADVTDQQRSNWPHFELVGFSEKTGSLSNSVERLLQNGVPKTILGCFQSAEELSLVDVPEHETFICFGSISHRDLMCLNPSTMAVVEVVASRFVEKGEFTSSDMLVRRIADDKGFYNVLFVNTTLDQFVASVRAVYARFPFDDGEEEDFDKRNEDWIQAGNELELIIGNIDPAATEDVNGFWYNFLWDVRIGNYAIDKVLSDSG